MTESTPPFLVGLRVRPEGIGSTSVFPFNLRFLGDLDLEFRTPVTFFVGENGSGKSTLLEAMALLCRLPASGGGRNEIAERHGPEEQSPLAQALRPAFRLRPPDAFFLRAEFHAHFASLLDKRAEDPDFGADPYARYGGRSLHARSHGESFLALLQNRIQAGLILLDEPESALSPQRQLALLALMSNLVAEGESQFVIATHSPILLTYPGADIVSFDGGSLQRVALEETSHYQITRGILQSPQSYWKHLRGEPEEGSA